MGVLHNMGESNWLSKGKFVVKDEYYTPKILVEPILKYLKPHSYIWCPFDTEHSEYVLMLKEHGHRVVNSHVWGGVRFF